MSGQQRQELSSVGQMVLMIVKAMVDHPLEVSVTEIGSGASRILEIDVHPRDVGKIIGKNGVHADAIRRLVTAAGGKLRRRYTVEIIEG